MTSGCCNVFKVCMSVSFSLSCFYLPLAVCPELSDPKLPVKGQSVAGVSIGLQKSVIYCSMIPCGRVGNKEVVGGTVRSEYDRHFRVTRAGGGEIDKNI